MFDVLPAFPCHKTRGSFYPGLKSSSSSYGNVGSFDPFAGFGSITAFVRGILGGSGGGGYSGPYGETTINYTYGQNGAGPHAVTSRSNGDSFTYDANGNMTQRVQNSVTWTQTFDAENRLVSVSDGTTTTQYVYDGTGNRVKKIVGNTTTIYVAGMEIEKVSGTETQRTIYYPAGGAFRVIIASPASNTVYYRHGDHLGSTSVLSDSTGAKVSGSEVVYAPFGVVRTGSESNLTDFGYTGQRHDDSTGGLMYYGARYYLPGVARFISADTIVPGMFNPQALNRYSYGYNNPINFNDPTGHVNQPMIDGYYSVDYVMNPKKTTPLPECPGGCQSNFAGQWFILPNSNSEAAIQFQDAIVSGGGVIVKGSEDQIRQFSKAIEDDDTCRMDPCQKDIGGQAVGTAGILLLDSYSLKKSGDRLIAAWGLCLIGAGFGTIGGGAGVIEGCAFGYNFGKEATETSRLEEITAGALTVAVAGLTDVVSDNTGFDPSRNEYVVGGDTIATGIFQLAGLIDDPTINFATNVGQLAYDTSRISGLREDWEWSWSSDYRGARFFGHLYSGPSPKDRP